MDTEGQPPNTYQLLLLQLLKMHHSVTNDDIEGFRNYCLHKQALASLNQGRLQMMDHNI